MFPYEKSFIDGKRIITMRKRGAPIKARNILPGVRGSTTAIDKDMLDRALESDIFHIEFFEKGIHCYISVTEARAIVEQNPERLTVVKSNNTLACYFLVNKEYYKSLRSCIEGRKELQSGLFDTKVAINAK